MGVEVYESMDDLEINRDDRGFLLAAHLALVPLVLMPWACLAPLSPVAGAFFLAVAMPRAGGTRFVTTQLLAIEVGLLVIGLAGQFGLVAAGIHPAWAAWSVAGVALLTLAGGVAALLAKGTYGVPLLAPLLFAQFFRGEQMFSGRPDV